MEVDTSRDGELSKLKRLAGELLATEALDPGVLDQIAALAAEVAAQCREQARLQLVERLTEATTAMFPEHGEGLRARLAQAAADELTAVEALLAQVTTTREAFARADADLRTAHRNGDYAAMAPLALDADKHKKALAAAISGVEEHLGLSNALRPETGTASEASAAPAVAEAVAAEPAATEDDPPAEQRDGASDDADADPLAEARAERPRLRALIRQMRAAPEPAAARR